MTRQGFIVVALLILAVIAVAIYSSVRCGPEVVVYTSIDEMPARKVLEDFQRQTGIRVKPLFDTEATKTIGLAMRVLSEMSRPQADVFWNNELSNTVNLARKGAFEAYQSPSAKDIPSQWKDPSGLWTSMGIRARVIVYNIRLVPADQAPTTLEGLCDPRWKGKVAVCDPRFGTFATHVAALAAAWGKDKTLDYFRRLAANGVKVMAGNSVVRDAAASGEIFVGLTDTDDVLLGIGRGMQIDYVFPDQAGAGQGTLVFPNAVSLVKGAPHPKEARRFIDYLLSADVERGFSTPKEGWIPVRARASADAPTQKLSSVKPMSVDWDAVSQMVGPFSAEVSGILVK